MELLPGVAPAASEPKFTESSSIFLNSADESNSYCRKLCCLSKEYPCFAQASLKISKSIWEDACASKVSGKGYATIPEPI